MTWKILILALSLVAESSSAVAQSATNEDWVGVWNAHMEGQLTSTLTLATDTGALGGTVVLDILCCEGETPHVIASDPHVLLNPAVAGSTLTFQVKMQKPNGAIVIASFEVKRTAANKATIHCVSCGVDAPVVELMKSQ
jgi:hypothetical protein